MVRQIDDLLRDLGWADGFHIPVANDENKTIEQQVEQKIKEKGELTIQFEELSDRVDSLKKYANNVIQEQEQNQAIITAHKRQVETEENLYRSLQAEQESYERELKRVNKTFQELGSRHLALQNSIFTHTEKLEKLKANVKWDKDTLLAWEEHVARSEEDNLLLERYEQQDESRAKELELTRQRLCKDVDERNRFLLEIIGNVDSLEKVLQRTAELFKQAHRERQETITQWENSVRVLHERDREIHRLVQEIAMVRAEGRKKLETLREHQHFCKNEMKNNKEAEVRIATFSRSVTHKEDILKKATKVVEELTQELATMRRTLATTASRVETQRIKNTSVVKDIKTKKNRIIEMTAVVYNTKKRLEEVTDNTTSAADRARHLEEMIQCEEKTMDMLARDTGKLNELLFQTQQDLFSLKKQEQQQQIDIRGLESAKGLVSSHIQQREKELSCQKEIVYNKEFEAQMIEARIGHMTGTDQDYEQKEANEKKITELENTLTETTATFNLLTAQIKRLEERMQGLTKSLAKDAAEVEKLVNKREDQVLMTDGGKKQLKFCKARNQDRQVEENILRLRVNQAEKAISREGDRVYSLERQRLELESTMKERQVEIAMQKDFMLVEKRRLNEEKSRFISDIKACEIKIGQLQKKYDIVMSSLGHTEDGEQLSVTYFKIKSAQEKYELQQEGDELDAKIRKTEKEILAMENTLKVINATNDTYRRNLAAVDEESDEYKKKNELKSQYFAAVDTLKERKSQLQDINKQIEILEQTLGEILVTEGNLKSIWRNKDQEATDLEKDLLDQSEKLKRAEKQLRKTVRELKSMSQSKLTPLEEKDMAVRELQEQNQSALQQLAELVARHMETGPVVTRYLQEKGLALPLSTARSPGSSRECPRHTKSSSALSLGSPSSSQLLVAESTTSQEVRSSDNRSSSSSSTVRSGRSMPSASVITLDPSQLDGTDQGGSAKTACASAAASLRRKQKREK